MQLISSTSYTENLPDWFSYGNSSSISDDGVSEAVVNKSGFVDELDAGKVGVKDLWVHVSSKNPRPRSNHRDNTPLQSESISELDEENLSSFAARSGQSDDDAASESTWTTVAQKPASAPRVTFNSKDSVHEFEVESSATDADGNGRDADDEREASIGALDLDRPVVGLFEADPTVVQLDSEEHMPDPAVFLLSQMQRDGHELMVKQHSAADRLLQFFAGRPMPSLSMMRGQSLDGTVGFWSVPASTAPSASLLEQVSATISSPEYRQVMSLTTSVPSRAAFAVSTEQLTRILAQSSVSFVADGFEVAIPGMRPDIARQMMKSTSFALPSSFVLDISRSGFDHTLLSMNLIPVVRGSQVFVHFQFKETLQPASSETGAALKDAPSRSSNRSLMKRSANAIALSDGHEQLRPYQLTGLSKYLETMPLDCSSIKLYQSVQFILLITALRNMARYRNFLKPSSVANRTTLWTVARMGYHSPTMTNVLVSLLPRSLQLGLFGIVVCSYFRSNFLPRTHH